MGKRIAALVAAVEVGGEVPSLVANIRDLQTRQRDIEEELTHLRPLPRLPASVVADRLAEWRRLLRASVTQGRALLQRITVGRIAFTPQPADPLLAPGGYDFAAQTRFDKLFSGVALPPPPDAVRGRALQGVEGITGADTWDGDYARLLEKAQKSLEKSNVEWVASPQGFEPWFQP